MGSPTGRLGPRGRRVGIGVSRVMPGRGERGRLTQVAWPSHPNQRHWMIRRRSVERGAGGHPHVRPAILIPAAPAEPVACSAAAPCRLSHARRDLLLRQGPPTSRVSRAPRQAASDARVRPREAGEHWRGRRGRRLVIPAAGGLISVRRPQKVIAPPSADDARVSAIEAQPAFALNASGAGTRAHDEQALASGMMEPIPGKASARAVAVYPGTGFSGDHHAATALSPPLPSGATDVFVRRSLRHNLCSPWAWTSRLLRWSRALSFAGQSTILPALRRASRRARLSVIGAIPAIMTVGSVTSPAPLLKCGSLCPVARAKGAPFIVLVIRSWERAPYLSPWPRPPSSSPSPAPGRFGRNILLLAMRNAKIRRPGTGGVAQDPPGWTWWGGAIPHHPARALLPANFAGVGATASGGAGAREPARHRVASLEPVPDQRPGATGSAFSSARCSWPSRMRRSAPGAGDASAGGADPSITMRGHASCERVPAMLRGDANLAWYLAARARLGGDHGGRLTPCTRSPRWAPAWQAGVFTTSMIAGRSWGT